VLAELPQAVAAHFACHGIFKSDRPAESGVVLRPSERPDVLSVKELSELDLSNLSHVTLSACWSADHFILPGRWVISLPETFARAGAASVLGCLWLVDDRVGAAFMEQFYRHLDRETRAKALQLTQLACLHGRLNLPGAPDTALPVFWAGYHLYGRADALRL
jgi:CHAT domain-containing protein